MIHKRTLVLARRVFRQLIRDKRTMGLVLGAPMLVLTLGSVLFRAEMPALPIGVVNADRGITIPMGGEIFMDLDFHRNDE